MIDTDKYEWDSKCRMVVIDGELYQRGNNGDYYILNQLHDKAVAQLVADAPLILEAYKRLREMLYIAENNIPRRIYWDCYVNALIEAGFEEGEEE